MIYLLESIKHDTRDRWMHQKQNYNDGCDNSSNLQLLFDFSFLISDGFWTH